MIVALTSCADIVIAEDFAYVLHSLLGVMSVKVASSNGITDGLY